MIDTVAMAVAADHLRCRALATMIRREHLSAEQVARRIRLSARRDRGELGAVIILCGGIARHAVDPSHWQDRGERGIVLAMIERIRFAECNRLAVQLVRRHWGEIAKNGRPACSRVSRA
jgi:hypothetical protein